jgi:hypothetical protein
MVSTYSKPCNIFGIKGLSLVPEFPFREDGYLSSD